MAGTGCAPYVADRFVLPIPDDWTSFDGQRIGADLVAMAPHDGAGFQANLVLVTGELPTGTDLETSVAVADQVLAEHLTDLQLLDYDHVQAGGHEAVHRRVRYQRDDTGPVTMEQWSLAHRDRLFVLTASAASAEYEVMATRFAAMVQGFQPRDATGES